MIKCVVVGKIKDKHLISLIQDYASKIDHLERNFSIVEVSAGNVTNENDSNQLDRCMVDEGNAILKQITSDDFVVILDLHGKEYTSETVSSWINTANMSYKGRLVFVIAGSYGYSQDVINRANIRWCLSKATFLHTIVRLLLVEQIYRGLMIQANRNYHK